MTGKAKGGKNGCCCIATLGRAICAMLEPIDNDLSRSLPFWFLLLSLFPSLAGDVRRAYSRIFPRDPYDR